MYDAKAIEEKWSKYWLSKKLFAFDDKDTKKPLYIIDTPPPFTSGELHMGNIMSFTLFEIAARYKKMRGFNVLLPHGWDAQGFPTERAVEKKYGTKLDRHEFHKKCVEVSSENINRMNEQIRKLGFVFDDRFEYSTLSSGYRAKVQLSLLLMNDKGMVYRGSHPVLWCTRCGSAIANAEIEDKEENTTINQIMFKVKGSKKGIVIATTRPEMLHACVAIAVNPDDKRYRALINKKTTVPIFNREVNIIADEKVDKDFGTGAEMVCTFGDKADIEMFHRHNLQLIEAIDESGKLKNAGDFNSLTIEEAREKIIDSLTAEEAFVKEEKLKHTVKTHDRCGTRTEYINSMQWFIKIKEHSEQIKRLANEVKWHPEFAKQRLYDWANFIDWDWVISRNRVYGTPIPFWICQKCGELIPADKKKLPVDPTRDAPPSKECPKCKSKLLMGEKATCDVWFDSSITPLVILGWPDNKALLERGLPNSLREQGTEIIRTWAFYTLFRVWALTGKKAWEEALINGMVLGFDGKIMHKSAGNGFAPDELLMKGYPVDAVRLWVALSGAVGKDRQFTYKDIDYAKSFLMKLYNSAMFVKAATEKAKASKEPHKDLNVFDLWILNRFNAITKEVTMAYDDLNFYDAGSKLINFYWHEFCDYYIENVKHRVYSKEKGMEKSKAAAQYALKHVLLNTLRLLAPIAAFTSEEINSMFSDKSVYLEDYPAYAEKPAPADFVINGLVFKSALVDVDAETAGTVLNDIISEVRKQKTRDRIALNGEISSININVPDEYINAVSAAKGELQKICKALDIAIKKSKEFSVTISK